MNENSGCSLLFMIGIFLGIGHILYVNRWEWIAYALGGILIVAGIIWFAESYQLKQKAERLDRLAKKISNNWK